MISTDQIERFHSQGFLLLPGFYDPAGDVAEIREGAQQIVALVARKHGLTVLSDTPEIAMSTGYLALIKANRSYGGEVYDAVKQIPAFLRLVSDARNSKIFRALRPDSIPGIAAGGFGIRIDNPHEEKYRAPWHQEFPAQLRSLDGIVFWSPLLAVTESMGPVQICIGSQREGLVPTYEDDQGANKTGAYALLLDREQERVARYLRTAPLTKPGDLLLLDFLTLHQSGFNVGDKPRWTMQFRYFNFGDPVGMKIGWKGSFAAGVKFTDVLAEAGLAGSKASP
jgi:hypothetical protein